MEIIHSIRYLPNDSQISEKIFSMEKWYQVWKKCFEEGIIDIDYDYCDYRGSDYHNITSNLKKECETKWNTILSLLYEKQKQYCESILVKKEQEILSEPESTSVMWIVILGNEWERKIITVFASNRTKAECLMIKHILSLNLEKDLPAVYIREIQVNIQPLNTSENFVSMF